MNAKDEVLSLLGSNLILEAATIGKETTWGESRGEEATLSVGYTEEEMIQFLKDLNFEYDQGYGGQELYGILWFKDGTWATRGEYDGSEWWVRHSRPEIPKELCK